MDVSLQRSLPLGLACGAYLDELTMITVSINGDIRQFPDATLVSALIDTLGLTGKRIALEYNGEILPRARFATQLLAEGDKLEVVVAVGGG